MSHWSPDRRDAACGSSTWWGTQRSAPGEATWCGGGATKSGNTFIDSYLTNMSKKIKNATHWIKAFVQGVAWRMKEPSNFQVPTAPGAAAGRCRLHSGRPGATRALPAARPSWAAAPGDVPPGATGGRHCGDSWRGQRMKGKEWDVSWFFFLILDDFGGLGLEGWVGSGDAFWDGALWVVFKWSWDVLSGVFGGF